MEYPQKNTTVTEAGADLLAQTNGNGKDSLIIDKAIVSNKLSSSSTPLEQTTKDEFANPWIVNIDTVTYQQNTIQPEVTFHNNNLDEDYPMYMIGLLAHAKSDTSGNEILYAVAEADDDPFIMPHKTDNDFEFTLAIPIGISNSDDVNIVTTEAGVVTNKIFKSYQTSIAAKFTNLNSSLTPISSRAASAETKSNANLAHTSLSNQINSLSVANNNLNATLGTNTGSKINSLTSQFNNLDNTTQASIAKDINNNSNEINTVSSQATSYATSTGNSAKNEAEDQASQDASDALNHANNHADNNSNNLQQQITSNKNNILFKQPQDLPDTDLNNDTNTGVYYLDGKSLTHCPTSSYSQNDNVWGLLIVVNTGTMCFQKIIKDSSYTFIRRLAGSPASWDSWQETTVTDFINNLQNQINNNANSANQAATNALSQANANLNNDNNNLQNQINENKNNILSNCSSAFNLTNTTSMSASNWGNPNVATINVIKGHRYYFSYNSVSGGSFLIPSVAAFNGMQKAGIHYVLNSGELYTANNTTQLSILLGGYSSSYSMNNIIIEDIDLQSLQNQIYNLPTWADENRTRNNIAPSLATNAMNQANSYTDRKANDIYNNLHAQALFANPIAINGDTVDLDNLLLDNKEGFYKISGQNIKGGPSDVASSNNWGSVLILNVGSLLQEFLFTTNSTSHVWKRMKHGTGANQIDPWSTDGAILAANESDAQNKSNQNPRILYVYSD